jgi:hypothetical protein
MVKVTGLCSQKTQNLGSETLKPMTFFAYEESHGLATLA